MELSNRTVRVSSKENMPMTRACSPQPQQSIISAVSCDSETDLCPPLLLPAKTASTVSSKDWLHSLSDQRMQCPIPTIPIWNLCIT
jgi:hypothetical protein